MSAPTHVEVPATHLFRARLAELTAEDSVALHRAVSALIDHVAAENPDEHDQHLIFNDLLTRIDPYWRVKVSH